MDSTMTNTYRIFTENLGKLQMLVAKQNRRAAKLGLAPILVTVSTAELVPSEDGLTVDSFTPVTITGQTPRLNGWEFVATIQHAGEAGNILRIVPTWEGRLPEEFRTSDPSRCDHCKQYRRRVDTFVVYNPHMTGQPDFAQVGRQCLADFVGSDKVAQMAEMAEMISLLRDACEAFGEERGSKGEHLMLLGEAISYATEAMLRFGWISRSKAETQQKTSTAQIAIEAMSNRGTPCSWKCPDPCPTHFEPSDEAYALADAVLAWAPEYIERELKRCDSDYVWNLKVVLANDVIPLRSFALAASILGAYQRDLERQAQIALERANTVSEWVGTEGERTQLTLTTKAFRYLESGYGTNTLITYHTPEGCVVKWFSSGEKDVTLEETGIFEATVKEHREYNGIKETHVLRVKPYQSPEAKKALAQARKQAKKAYETTEQAVKLLWEQIPEDRRYTADYNRDMPELVAYNDARAASRQAYQAWKAL